jgi:hypothetical protein
MDGSQTSNNLEKATGIKLSSSQKSWIQHKKNTFTFGLNIVERTNKTLLKQKLSEYLRITKETTELLQVWQRA